jgi:hypothetical protein
VPAPAAPPPPAPVAAVAGDGNLLKGKFPIKVEGVTDPARMTDGLASPEGDGWKSTRTSVVPVNGSVVWDLGEVRPLKAGMLQGDNNDDYLLESSVDGAEWKPLWRVHTVNEAGMRLRQSRELDGAGRYVRLSAKGGDSMYSVAEVELHSAPDTMAESGLKRQRGRESDEVPIALWLATLGAIAFLVSSKQKILWIIGAPLVASLAWASVTMLLDRFVG